MALSAEVLGDRWLLLILREAFYGVQRYDDMLQDLGIPRATLTDRLNKLLDLKILERHAYQGLYRIRWSISNRCLILALMDS